MSASFKISEARNSTISGTVSNYKNTLIITVLSDQEFITTDDNYLIWIEVTCFREDEIRLIVDDIVKFSSIIYNNNSSKKSVTLIGLCEYIEKHSSLRMDSNFPLHFRLHFSNVKEVQDNNLRIVKEKDLTKEEYDSVFNNNNYMDVLEDIFD